MTENERAIRDHLKAMAHLTKDRLKAGQQSPHRFMLKHGRTFTVTPNTFKGPRGVPKQCYANAGGRAKRGRKGLCYTEGFVSCAGLPIPHAWLVTPEGHVIDPTLKGDDEDGRAYFGLAFDIGYHRVAIMKSTYWSLLEYQGVALGDIIHGRTQGMLSAAHHSEVTVE